MRGNKRLEYNDNEQRLTVEYRISFCQEARMQKMVSYDYRKSFYISGHITGTIRGLKVTHYIELFIFFKSKVYHKTYFQVYQVF